MPQLFKNDEPGEEQVIQEHWVQHHVLAGRLERQRKERRHRLDRPQIAEPGHRHHAQASNDLPSEQVD